MFTFITYQVSKRVAVITLNRPEKRNALHPDVVSELITAFDTAREDESVKVIVLKANGEAFCAGADLAYLQQLQQNTFEENLADSRHLKRLFELIYNHPKVVIAQIEGHALAGGCGLATVCDFAFAIPEAKFGFTEVKIGFIPAIVMVFLLRKTTEKKAKELLLTGNLISAQEAVNYGIITKVVDKEAIAASVNEFISNLLHQTSATSLTITKQMIAAVQHLSVEEALEYAAQQNAKAREGADCKKGIAAFLNKEKLNW